MTATMPKSLREARVRIRRDETRWLRAKTYAGLLRLNVLFLKGEIITHPDIVITPEYILDCNNDWMPPIVHEETLCILDDLIALNKLGLLTTCSQPGSFTTTEHESHLGKKFVARMDKARNSSIEQRAFVSGFAPPDLAKRLLRAAGGDIVVVREKLKPIKFHVMTRQGRTGSRLKPFTWAGRAQRPDLHGRIGEDAAQALATCVQIGAYDKKWRRNTLLWSTLLTAARMT